MVGIGEEYYERSPFELSGGEKRRIAIAGILAMEPDILVLDEPTAGLDPEGSNIILSLIENLYKDGKTIILVTHNMNIVMEYCKRALVLHQGKIVFDGTPNELFDSLTNEMAIDMPPLYKFILELRQKGFNIEPNSIHNAEELAFAIKKELRK